ncbi:hypothetical protein VTI28DRAFT_678 [Corynascus sepedonium]
MMDVTKALNAATANHKAKTDTFTPWRCFWPPIVDSESYKRLEKEHPDVLTWRFDITRPFDRPWRLWTIPSPAEGGICSLQVAQNDPAPAIQRERRDLDEEFRGLNLPTVQPDCFHHLAPLERYQKEKPYKCQLPRECFPGFQMHNLMSKSYRVSITNISGHEARFSLPVSGFEFAKCPITVNDWTDKNVSFEYLPRLAKWLKQRFGCRDVFCYAYNFRHHGSSRKSDGQKYEFKPPFLRAHCDATEATCQARLQLYFPDSYQALMRDRVRFINVWRPISPAPVEDCPLALCDFRTVNREDLVPMDIVYPHFVDEAYEVKHNPSHRWFYKKGMTQEDVIVFKLFDSLGSEATVCPHSAFVDPSAPSNTPRRASIEVKAIVLG